MSAPSGKQNAEDRFERIAPLLERAGVYPTPEQVRRLKGYGELLMRWNQRIHLTGQRHRLFSHHILDCAMVALPPLADHARRAVDIGSGAGLPAVVLAILRPELAVDALDTSAKKVSFLQVVAGELGLTNLRPRREDVRQWMAGAGREAYDLTVSRAFAKVETLLELGQQLLTPGGEVWCFKGQKLSEEQAEVSAASLAGFDAIPRVYPYDFPETGTGGQIAVYRKLQAGSASGPGRGD